MYILIFFVHNLIQYFFVYKIHKNKRQTKKTIHFQLPLVNNYKTITLLPLALVFVLGAEDLAYTTLLLPMVFIQLPLSSVFAIERRSQSLFITLPGATVDFKWSLILINLYRTSK